MCNAVNLLVDYWPEYYKIINYLLNYISTKRFNWKIPFEITNNTKLDLSHIHVYKAKTYVLRNKIPCKNRFEFYIYIGFLVGYDLCNIYYIWFFSSKCVMRTKDVIFVEDEFYKPDKLDLGFVEDVEKIVKYFKILPSRPVFEQKESDSDEEVLPYIYN